mmetsp:Transcript_30959/g.75728  ORF Transcript_30959/g.75728 Transcript_30959/m.75728 type:complete len:202 (-) Transcript_30959:320-925(-)
MKILGLFVCRALPSDAEAVVLSSAYHLSDFSYFQRGSIKEFAGFFAKTLAKRVPLGQRSSVEHEAYLCHVHVRSNGLSTIALCDKEYPSRVAFTLLAKLQDDFLGQVLETTWKNATGEPEIAVAGLEEMIAKYQNPSEADSLMKIQKDLDDTKVILHKTIDSVLERGVKLDNLVEKSNDLSTQSKMFYKTAKSQNSCCGVM